MDSRQSVELTIRTAQLMQAVGSMVGTSTIELARLRMANIAKLTMDLDQFVESCDA